MKRYAVVDPNNVVVNVVLWDEASGWRPPEEHIIVKAEDVLCDIGWTHDNGNFIAPPEPVFEEPTQS
jgi:hypothetical protein